MCLGHSDSSFILRGHFWLEILTFVIVVVSSRFCSKPHNVMLFYDFWFAVAPTEWTSKTLCKAFFEAASMVEPFFVNRFCEFFNSLSHKLDLFFNLFFSFLFTDRIIDASRFKLLLHTFLHCIENKWLLGAIEEDHFLCERQIHVLIYEILHTDTAFEVL